MKLKSLLCTLMLCAVVSLLASIVFPHFLLPNALGVINITEAPHLFASQEFLLAWLPWFASFLFTSFLSTWIALRCKHRCTHKRRDLNNPEIDDDDNDDEDETIPAGPREVGVVKWFNGKKGFGFITRNNGEDIFVHHRSIHMNGRGGRRFLNEGQKVEFTVVHKGKGPQAEHVVTL